jgi:hypothetical protein
MAAPGLMMLYSAVGPCRVKGVAGALQQHECVLQGSLSVSGL